MTRVLLLTNDFPPRKGGIQSYLENLVLRLAAAGEHELTVYAPGWKGAVGYDRAALTEQGLEIVRHPGTLMLPVPAVEHRMRDLITTRGIETIWFGAAAPLALLGPAARRAGVSRVVASTHGHEVGWSMLPGARTALRRIGSTADVITYVSRYTRSRFAAAFGAGAAFEHLPPGVDSDLFQPNPLARNQLRDRYGLGERPVVVCVSRLVPRKGQDMLIRALPAIRAEVPDAALVIVGGGPHLAALRGLTVEVGVSDQVTFTEGVPFAELPGHYAMGDVFAMPCRTRGAGLDVEGLGIVFLEASATGIPVVAGDSGGAPEAVLDGETGYVVDGRDVAQIAGRVAGLLADPALAARMGARGREWVTTQWRWDDLAARLGRLL